jgi:hypothetical protein
MREAYIAPKNARAVVLRSGLEAGPLSLIPGRTPGEPGFSAPL